jgi:hypothetical protein
MHMEEAGLANPDGLRARQADVFRAVVDGVIRQEDMAAINRVQTPDGTFAARVQHGMRLAWP